MVMSFVPAMVDFSATPVVKVEIKYADPQRGQRELGTLVFTDKTPQEWFLAVPVDAPRVYSVEYTYHLADGEVVTMPPVRGEGGAVIVPRYKPR